MPLEEKLILRDRSNSSLPAYKKNNHQVSASDGEGGALVVAPLVTGGEHVLMDQWDDVIWTRSVLSVLWLLKSCLRTCLICSSTESKCLAVSHMVPPTARLPQAKGQPPPAGLAPPNCSHTYLGIHCSGGLTAQARFLHSLSAQKNKWRLSELPWYPDLSGMKAWGHSLGFSANIQFWVLLVYECRDPSTSEPLYIIKSRVTSPKIAWNECV